MECDAAENRVPEMQKGEKAVKEILLVTGLTMAGIAAILIFLDTLKPVGVWPPAPVYERVELKAMTGHDSVSLPEGALVSLALLPAAKAEFNFATMAGKVGTLSWENGIMKFEGNADASAQILFDKLISIHETYQANLCGGVK